MNVLPIPKELLIHTATYEEFTGVSVWGETFAAPVTLTNVLVQPSTEVIRDTVREAINARALLFYDFQNSGPAIARFVEKSRISFGSFIYTVGQVKTLYAFDNVPHHIELILV